MKLLRWGILSLGFLFFPKSGFAEFTMQFQYVPNEGEGTALCQHERIRDLPDWKVICGDKVYTAHVIVRGANRATTPETMLEILYWVTEPGVAGGPAHQFHSTTAIIRMKEKARLDSMVLFQGVENDQASLRMELTEPGSSAGLRSFRSSP